MVGRNTGEKDRVRRKKGESEMQENVMPMYNAQVEVNYTKEKEEVKREWGKKAKENENYSTSK